MLAIIHGISRAHTHDMCHVSPRESTQYMSAPLCLSEMCCLRPKGRTFTDRTAIVKGQSWLQFLLVQAMMVSDILPTRDITYAGNDVRYLHARTRTTCAMRHHAVHVGPPVSE